MNEARLRIIDKLLQKGWQSYYDIAKVIHESFVTEKQFGKLKKWSGVVHDSDCFYDALLTEYRPSLSHDILDIPDIWAYSHHGKLSKKGKSTGEKNQLRAEARTAILDIKEQKEFKSNEDPELYIKNEKKFRENPTVQYFKYKNPKYSIFDTGDYEKFLAQGTKKRTKSAVERSIKESITKAEVDSVLNDSDVVLDEAVSNQIKRSILIQEEIREFAQESRNIVESFLKDISTKSEQKKRNWVKETVNKYKNILELVKNPLSKYNPREIADQIHEFAFFLATENQYHLLGNRFDEALTIYQKLRREQRHLIEDIEQGLITADEAVIDVIQTKEQMAQDDESVTSILLSIARVSLDSGDEKKAKELIKKAKGLSGGESLSYARICHLESVIAGMDGNVNQALTLVDEAFKIIDTIDLENSAEGIAILASKAELMQRMGKTAEAKELYGALLAKDCADDAAREMRTSAYLNLAVINFSEGQIEEADRNVTVALSEFQALYGKEPDKHLPNVMTAKYIKGLALMHLGDMESAISILEEASSMVPDNRPDLYALCGAELLEIYVTLHDLYASTGYFDRANDMSIKAKELLTMPAIRLSDEQKETIIQTIN